MDSAAQQVSAAGAAPQADDPLMSMLAPEQHMALPAVNQEGLDLPAEATGGTSNPTALPQGKRATHAPLSKAKHL